MVIGAGHNGLITAAYLARAGRRTLLVEARDRVGGTAGSDPFAGGSVNTCNCDHLTFRTTPVRDELRLADFGLRYVDLTPSSAARSWSGGPQLAGPPRRRGHHRRTGPRPSRRGRRLPALPEGGAAGRPHDPRGRQRAAVDHRADPHRAARGDSPERRRSSGGAVAAPPT